MPDLKLCPFCGGEAAGPEHRIYRACAWRVYCTVCGVEICGHPPELVVARWNTRAPLQHPAMDTLQAALLQIREIAGTERDGEAATQAMDRIACDALAALAQETDHADH